MIRESMEFDVVIIGAGPAGLSAAIKLAQLSQQHQIPLSICIVEKGAAVGAHILSGAVLEPRALDELLPDWKNNNAPLNTPVMNDQFFFLTQNKTWRLPTPPQMRNRGNFIISLGQFCQWLAEQAENLGVNIFPGFAAVDILYENNQVVGIITDDKGLDKFGQQKSTYQPGIELRAKQTIFAEGCRGSLTQGLFERYQLNNQADPQTYGLGIKEVWKIPENDHQKGHVMHSIGWPLDHNTYGGSFVYQFDKDLLAIGFVIGLDYTNPYLNPYEEFQRFKTHPLVYPLLKNGQRIAYGARCLIEGGLQSIPKLTFPGGLIIGDCAGFLNVPKIKGIHNAMKSGMVAASSLFSLFTQSTEVECLAYTEHLKSSWLWQDLYLARNIRPAMRFGLPIGLLYSAIDTYLLRGRAPWTFHHKIADHASLHTASLCKKVDYPKHDNQVTFDITQSVYLTHTHSEENQPCHLKLKNDSIPVTINLDQYDAPEQRYCPAGVYEIVPYPETRLQINASNCIHCKACDIKDPTQNIIWTPPEGGSGPQYESM
jgi:electron-transferring-flavoprotein dehydrogenase